MAYTLPTNIATTDLQRLTKYTFSGILHIFVEKSLFRRSKWDQKYIVICQISADKCTWNMCCYAGPFEKRAEINYSMLEFESVQEYEDVPENIIGFIMKFEEPTRRPLIFRCDIKESRNKWMEHVHTAILEAHKDSGYSTDTDRQSKKYETIDDINNSKLDKPHSTDTETDELDNISQAITSWQLKTGITGAAVCRDLEPNATEDCDDVGKHSYENMMAENNSFKSLSRKESCQEKLGADINGRNRYLDETFVISHPVQETEKEIRNDESLAKNHKKRKPKKNRPEKKYPQCHAVTSSEHAIETDHVYENVTDSLLQMDVLKSEFPPYDGNRIDCSHTEIKEMHRGETGRKKSITHDAKKDKVICELNLKFNGKARDAFIGKGRIKASIKSNISERESTSSSESESLPESPDPSQEPPCLTSVINDENTVLKLPFASSPTSTLGVSSSFVTVQGCSECSNAGSKSFVSVGEGTNDSATVSSSINKRHVYTESDLSDSFTSTKENRTCSSLTRKKTFASPHERTRSSPMHSTTHSLVQEQQIHSLSKDTASFASVRDDRTCSSSMSSSSSLTIPKSNANQSLNSKCLNEGRQNRSTSIDSTSMSSVRNGPVSFSPVTPESSVTVRTDGAQYSLHKSETRVTLTGGDDEVIYENTDTCYAAENKDYRRQESDSSRGSNNSCLHSSNSSSSCSSRDSNTSSTIYESPDESAHYENTKFLREEYFCEEKTKVKRMLKNKSEGTFLVCPGEPRMELCVMTPVGIRYFRIHEQEDKLSLFRIFSNPDCVLPNLDTLLFYYRIHDLPSKEYQVKLVKGYNSKDEACE